MAKKQGNEERADISPEFHQRIVKLSTLLWEGNRSKMARDVGIDQPTISRVLAGEQKPSAKLLENLAARPEVNVGWLFLGEGEPLLTQGMRAGVGGYRPLLDELLPGPLHDHRDRLAGVSYPVAAAFDTPTSYWYRVPANSPATTSEYKVKAGDLMLMETDPAWTRKVSSVAGRFCVFPVRRGKKEVVELWWIDEFNKMTPFDAYKQYRVDTFTKPIEETWLIVSGEGDGEEEARRSVPGLHKSLEQIVSACVKLERPFMKAARV